MFPEQLDGRVYLHRLRHPIYAEQCRAAGVPHLRRRAAIRSATRTNLDNAGSAGGWTFQLIPPVRAWSDRHWDTAALCDWPTRAGCLHAQWKCLDCIAMLDPATIALINGLGSLKAIAISHPHFYTTMVEWSRAFGGVPIHLHADDHRWIMRPDPSIQLWNGETLKLLPDVTLIRCGGHFPGGTVLHWAKGAGGRGVLCSSDIATVTTDRKFLSFMRSYPNLIPLSAKQVTGI